MARRPSLASRARIAQAKANPPIRFIADYDHVEMMVTQVYPAGTSLIDVPDAVRAGALAAKKAVVDGE